jgi:hypothetical protein
MSAAKIDELDSLLQSAMEAGSFKDVHKYSSLLLEIDSTRSSAWILKAAATSALMVNSDEVGIEEVVFCLDRGRNGSESSAITAAVKVINSSCRKAINKLDAVLKEKILDQQKIPMPQGGSVILHRVAQVGYASLTAKGLAPKRLSFIKLLEKCYEILPSEDGLMVLIEEVNSFLSHSSKYSNYLDSETEIKSYILRLQSKLGGAAKNLGIEIPKTSKSQSGCFIATAAVGSYDHPKVVALRIFRDCFLRRHRFGLIFIDFYYKTSPPIANWISRKEMRRLLVLWLVVNPLSKISARLLK